MRGHLDRERKSATDLTIQDAHREKSLAESSKRSETPASLSLCRRKRIIKTPIRLLDDTGDLTHPNSMKRVSARKFQKSTTSKETCTSVSRNSSSFKAVPMSSTRGGILRGVRKKKASHIDTPNDNIIKEPTGRNKRSLLPSTPHKGNLAHIDSGRKMMKTDFNVKPQNASVPAPVIMKAIINKSDKQQKSFIKSSQKKKQVSFSEMSDDSLQKLSPSTPCHDKHLDPDPSLLKVCRQNQNKGDIITAVAACPEIRSSEKRQEDSSKALVQTIDSNLSQHPNLLQIQVRKAPNKYINFTPTAQPHAKPTITVERKPMTVNEVTKIISSRSQLKVPTSKMGSQSKSATSMLNNEGETTIQIGKRVSKSLKGNFQQMNSPEGEPHHTLNTLSAEMWAKQTQTSASMFRIENLFNEENYSLDELMNLHAEDVKEPGQWSWNSDSAVQTDGDNIVVNIIDRMEKVKEADEADGWEEETDQSIQRMLFGHSLSELNQLRVKVSKEDSTEMMIPKISMETWSLGMPSS